MIPALILAGGRATRLGGVNKPLLKLGPATVLDELLRRLRPQAGPLAIGAPDPAPFARFGLPVLGDPEPGQGPLGGVLAGLRWAAGAEALLTVPGDTPFLPPDLAARLAPAPACAAGESGTHHLVALWPVSAEPALAAFLAAGGRRVSEFAAGLGARAVFFPGTPDPFRNINTEADLAAARAEFSRMC